MALTLEQIRQQLNIPKTTSDAEVIRIAQENNIVINFSGNKPADNLPSLNTKNNPSGSVWTAGQSTAAKSSQGGVYGDMGLSLSSNQSTTAASKSISTITSSSALSSSLTTDNNVTASITQSDVTHGTKKSHGSELKEDIDHYVSENGWTTIYKKDGTEISRKARMGEAGFNEKGENFDQRMQRYFNISSDEYMALSDDKKKEYSERYQKGIRQSAYNAAIKKGKSKEEAKQIADNAVINDFRALARRSGKSPEEMKGIAMTLYGLEPEAAEREVKRYVDESVTKEDALAFSSGVVENIDLADDPKMQTSVTNGIAEAAKNVGISEEVGQSIGNAITANKFHGREATIEALRTQYGLSPEQANAYYKNLPEETRQKIEDETLDAISTVQTEIAADSSQSEDVRHDAADLSTGYMTYIDNAEYQMQVIQNNNNYMQQNGDKDIQEYYTNSLAKNAYNYDSANRDEIINMVKEQGSEKTLEILEDARKEYETKQAEEKATKEAASDEKSAKTNEAEKAENVDNQNAKTTKSSAKATNAQAQTQSQTKTSSVVYRKHSTFSSSLASNIARRIMSEDFKNSSKQEKEQFFSSLDVSQRKQAVGALVENSQPYELKSYMHGNMKNSILRYLIYHPTPKNQEALKFLSSDLSTSDKKYIDDVREERLKLIGEANRTQDDKKSENTQSQFTSSQIHNQTQPFASQNGVQRLNGNNEAKRNPFLFG